jgi:hypothetical protein
MGTWLNADGLYIKYGTDEAAYDNAGEYKTDGPLRLIELELDLTTVGSSPAIFSDNALLQEGYRVEKVEVVTVTGATGATAVLNIGLQRTDRSTELDYNGLVAALPVASMSDAGETTSLVFGATYAGALIGTTLAYNGHLVADYDTAAFSAGVVKVRIYVSKP